MSEANAKLFRDHQNIHGGLRIARVESVAFDVFHSIKGCIQQLIDPLLYLVVRRVGRTDTEGPKDRWTVVTD